MKVRVFNLGATESYRERVAVLMDGGTTAAERFLTITTRAGNKTTTVTYVMNTDRLRPGLEAHLVPLRGDGGKGGEGGPYWVTRSGDNWACNCRGFRQDGSVECKHISSVKAVKKQTKEATGGRE